jgi:hypothetical protein
MTNNRFVQLARLCSYRSSNAKLDIRLEMKSIEKDLYRYSRSMAERTR